MKYGSLFSGIGGLDLGMDWAGHECLWQVEYDDWRRDVVLEKHWPGIPKYKDVRTVDYASLPEVDVLTGGFPCQPHSIAGKKKGSKDERDLWEEMLHAIKVTQPRYTIAENVHNILRTESGQFFRRLLGSIADAGFNARWQTLSARAFGAPHLRKRVFIIIYPNDIQFEFIDVERWLQSQEWPESEKGWKPVWWNFIRTVDPKLWPETVPGILRSDDGLPDRMDLEKKAVAGYGNAVVPILGKYLGDCINYSEELNNGE